MRNAFAVFIALAVVACGGGGSESQDATVKLQDATVSMFKFLGSVQCTGGGVTLAALQSQLSAAGILILATSCGTDGVVYPAVCGAPDGAIGIFEVPEAQLLATVALNFALLSTLPAVATTSCG